MENEKLPSALRRMGVKSRFMFRYVFESQPPVGRLICAMTRQKQATAQAIDRLLIAPTRLDCGFKNI
jgi:hypothetical protein